jgi:hypothetical protein
MRQQSMIAEDAGASTPEEWCPHDCVPNDS